MVNVKSVKSSLCKLRTFISILILLSTLGAIEFIYFTYNTKKDVLTDDGLTFAPLKKSKIYNVWITFARVNEKSPFKYKFHNLLENILNVSTISLKFHILVDNSSKQLAIDQISDVVAHSGRPIYYMFYDVEACARKISDIAEVMMPHFSSKPGTYYSDALFYISLGLHRIAPISQEKVIILDCDVYFKRDIKLVFDQFDSFKPQALFGLAPELSPVYYHILQNYKSSHKTTFGEFYRSEVLNGSLPHPRGFQGYNSGVILINLDAVRKSEEYAKIIQSGAVTSLTDKYKFKGHLGDQDFYTLVGFEYPHLIQTLHCGFNRQLCLWWKDTGYRAYFNNYFKCRHSAIILHGNCNTKIPKN